MKSRFWIAWSVHSVLIPITSRLDIRLEQIKNPPLPVSDALINGVTEEPLVSNATLAEPPEEVAGTVAWEPPTAESLGNKFFQQSPRKNFLGDHPSQSCGRCLLWLNPRLPPIPPYLISNFLTGGPGETKEELDLFAPGAFETYNAESQEALTPSEAARPWVEELLQTLNAAEELEAAEKPIEDVPAWAIPAQELSIHGAEEPMDQLNKARMSPAEIVLLIILILLVLLVGGYFGLSLLGLL